MSLEQDLEPIKEKLQKALELELTTIPPYLVAMYSIHPGSNHAAAEAIRSVFMEEMLHMVLVANILIAIGGTVKLGEYNVPIYPCRLEFEDGKTFKDRRFDVQLGPLSKETLEIFLKIELPEFLGQAEPAGGPHLHIPGYTVGEFYNQIAKEIAKAVETHGDAVFSGKSRPQVGEDFYWSGAGKPIIVKDLSTMREAIDLIVEQGEGAEIGINPPPNFFADEVPHYFRFKEILLGRRYRPNDDPRGNPTGDPFPVDFSKVYPLKVDCTPEDFADQPELKHLDSIFNANYSLMLAQLEQGFNGSPRAFYTAIMNGMHNLGPIARSMVQIPLDSDPKLHAAPTFRWVDPY